MSKCITISSMVYGKPNLGNRASAFVCGVICAAVLAACAAPQSLRNTPQQREVASDADVPFHYTVYRVDEVRDTLRAGLKGITQRYIDPVAMDSLALEGLNGLASIDPSITVGAKDNTIILFRESEAIADYPRPLTDDAQMWAELSASLIRSGRQASFDLRNADHERIYEAVFDGMLSRLDPFSRYAGAEEAYANRARRDGFGGIGIRFSKAETGVLITHVQPDSPAAHLDLHTGDIIFRINDTDIRGYSLRKVAKMLRGPIGSHIIITLARMDDNATKPDRHISYTLERAHIVPETVRVKLQGEILNIRISSFNKRTASTLRQALKDHVDMFDNGKIKGIVLDVRDNPGGLLSQSVSVADLFLKQGMIITTRGRHPDSYHNYTAGGQDYAHEVPLAVLIDANSASAAEIVASALQDAHRAVLVGSTSYGKGTVQTVIRLPNGGEITLTWSRLMAPSGYAIHGLGVLPVFCAQHGAEDNATQDEHSHLLDIAHLDAIRPTMQAWREAGAAFDGRRLNLRKSCPTQAFFPPQGKSDRVLEIAQKILGNPDIYDYARNLTLPISTARRP